MNWIAEIKLANEIKMANTILYLSNVEIFEYCEFDRSIKKIVSMKKERPDKIDGLFFRQGEIFVALYWYNARPVLFFEGKEYMLNKNLNIQLEKDDHKRVFKIIDYEMEVHYKESKYINMDDWSNEIDIDLFCKIIESYKTDEFYENKPQRNFKFPWTNG